MKRRARFGKWYAWLSIAAAGCAQNDRELTLGRSVEEPAPSIAETVQSTLVHSDFSITIKTASDTSEILAAVRDGGLDLAIVEEPSEPFSGVTTLAPLYPSVLHVLHNRELPSVNFESLMRGASVYAGPPGGAAHRLLLQLTEDFNLENTDFTVLENPWTVIPDVYFILGGLLAPESVETLAGYRFFSFGADTDVDGAALAHGIALRHHQVRPFLLPRDLYYGLNDEPVLTLSIRSVLIANADLASDLGYEISSAMFVNAQEISQSYPLVTRELNEDLQSTDLILPLHAGTRRFLDRDHPGLIERNAEVIALYFSIIFTALSGAVAFYQYRMRVRKNRVDVYLARLLDIRSDMSATGMNSQKCKKKVLAVQSEVLQLLIDERIAADASLMAFMGQSNQIINELDRMSREDPS